MKLKRIIVNRIYKLNNPYLLGVIARLLGIKTGANNNE